MATVSKAGSGGGRVDVETHVPLWRAVRGERTGAATEVEDVA
jgi:hypothetical protein